MLLTALKLDLGSGGAEARGGAVRERLQRKSCRDVLRQCRLDQLRIIRNDMRETEAKLKELRRAEALLTTESERDAALRFFNQTAFSPAGRHGSVASALPGSDGGGALPRVNEYLF